jgi:hypothetical protein
MGESAASKLNTLLLLAVIGILVWGIVSKPQPRTETQQLLGKFQPLPGSQFFALDTTTGKACAITPNRPHILTEKEQRSLGWIPEPTEPLPLCSELK